MSISDVLRRLEVSWGEPRSALHGGTPTFFKLRCQVAWGAVAFSNPKCPPNELGDFWNSASEARLFVDEDYGQWGLLLLSPGAAHVATERFRSSRESDYRTGDLIVGEFRGDSDLLLVRCDPMAKDFGEILVVGPLDSRDDWDSPAPNLLVLLERLESEQGRKFWE